MVGSPVQTGMDPGWGGRWPSGLRLPRADGDGPRSPQTRQRGRKAPPCRRGWTGDWQVMRFGAIGSPVQTGMDPPRRTASSAGPRLPRADGDGPAEVALGWGAALAPPCRRGWTLAGLGLDHVLAGSPVQTGMDRSRNGQVAKTGRLPRADGDGPCGLDTGLRAAAAPPCRRGWTG